MNKRKEKRRTRAQNSERPTTEASESPGTTCGLGAMCKLPWRRLWSCCCSRRASAPPGRGGDGARGRSEGKGAGRGRGKSSKRKHRRPGVHSSSAERHRSRSADQPLSRRASSRAPGSRGTDSRRHAHRRSSSGPRDRNRDRERARSEARAEAERALIGAPSEAPTAATATTRSRSYRPRTQSVGRDEHGGGGGRSHVPGTGERTRRKRRSSGHSGGGGVHDDSGYKTESAAWRRSASRPGERSSTGDFDYTPRAMDGSALPRRHAADLDYTPRPMDGKEPSSGAARGILRRPAIVNMLHHNSSEPSHDEHHYRSARDAKPRDKHSSRSRSRPAPNGTSAGAATGDVVVNLLRHDDANPVDARDYAAARELKRTKPSGHRSGSSSNRSHSRPAADATQQQHRHGGVRGGHVDDLPRRRSTRKKPIRPTDVDPNYRDPDDPDASDSDYVASADDTSLDDRGGPTRSASQRVQPRRRPDPEALRRTKSARGPSSAAPPRSISQQRRDVDGVREADPRQRTEFSLGNLERLAAEGLQHRSALVSAPPVTAVRPRAMDAPALATAASSAKPSFTYREDGPLPRTEPEHRAVLASHIARRQLTALLPSTSPAVRRIADTAAARAPAIARALQLSLHATPDLTTLGLYDVIIFCDDSSSMLLENRWGTLRTVVRRIARIANAYNPAGIKLRFINATNDAGHNGIVTEAQVETCLDTVSPAGDTRIGTKLFQKVVLREIVERAQRGLLERPVVVSIVTDGEVCPPLSFSSLCSFPSLRLFPVSPVLPLFPPYNV